MNAIYRTKAFKRILFFVVLFEIYFVSSALFFATSQMPTPLRLEGQEKYFLDDVTSLSNIGDYAFGVGNYDLENPKMAFFVFTIFLPILIFTYLVIRKIFNKTAHIIFCILLTSIMITGSYYFILQLLDSILLLEWGYIRNINAVWIVLWMLFWCVSPIFLLTPLEKKIPSW